MASGGSTQKRSNDAGNDTGATNKARVNSPFLKRHPISADNLCPGENAGRNESSNRSPNDKPHRIRGGATHEGTKFEQGEGGEKSPLYAEVSIEFAEEKLGCAGGEEVGGTVPCHVVEGLKLISDVGDGGSDDHFVQGDAKIGYTRGQICNEELGIAGHLLGQLQLQFHGLKRLYGIHVCFAQCSTVCRGRRWGGVGGASCRSGLTPLYQDSSFGMVIDCTNDTP